ncbi:MAG: ParA family protein [Dehalococcoidia bacterium]|nr:ParA family protein [Dehalococcoidia bacterium]
MARVIAIANQKGGVGKTTTTISLGAALSELGARVLLIDMDSQGTLSVALGIHGVEKTIYDVLRDLEMPLEDVLVRTVTNCDLAPSNIHLAGAEVELLNEPGREFILKGKLASVDRVYDYVLLDCPPSLGLMTLNAFTAARQILIPVQAHFLAFRGMQLLLTTISKVKIRLNPGLEVLGILPTFYDARTRHSREVVEQLKEHYGEKVIEIPIPSTIKFADTTTAGESILTFSSASAAAASYRKLAREVHNGQTSKRR